MAFVNPEHLAEEQFDLCWTWMVRARRSDDVFYRFICMFMAFNALYFIWRRIDPVLAARRRPSEADQIQMREQIAEMREEIARLRDQLPSQEADAKAARAAQRLAWARNSTGAETPSPSVPSPRGGGRTASP